MVMFWRFFSFFTSSYITEPTVIVQNRPAKESAIRAPMRGVKPAVPPKLVRVLDACTIGRFSCWVRYVIMFAWNPVVANLSHTSFAAVRLVRFGSALSHIIYSVVALSHLTLITDTRGVLRLNRV